MGAKSSTPTHCYIIISKTTVVNLADDEHCVWPSVGAGRQTRYSHLGQTGDQRLAAEGEGLRDQGRHQVQIGSYQRHPERMNEKRHVRILELA